MAYKPKVLTLSDGGTNSNLTASNGGILYSTASAMSVLSATATANQILLSGASTAPTWSTATYPATSGSSGNILASNGTNFTSQSPSSLGSSFVLISTQTASNVANITWTGLSTYARFLLMMSDARPITNTDNLLLNISINNGSTYINTGYTSGFNWNAYNSTTLNNVNLTSAFIIAGPLVNSGGPPAGVNGTYVLYNISVIQDYPSISGHCVFSSSTGPIIANGISIGANTNLTAINALQITCTSSNIQTGVFSLYGIIQ